MHLAFSVKGDNMEFSAKITNLSENDLNGNAQLYLYDATSMKDITATITKDGQRAFTSKKGQSSFVSWNISIPEGVGAITYKVVAKAGNFSDGEEMAIACFNKQNVGYRNIAITNSWKPIKNV
jgi:hypothetical protein